MNVQIRIADELKPCGQLYLTDKIMTVFQDILGEDKVMILE